MAKKKSVEELYNGIFTIRESLQEVVQLAGDVVTMSQAFGGEIPRVLTEQFSSYFIPAITKFIDDEETPGAMTPLITFLDSVPLAMTREEPQPQQLPPAAAPATPLAEPPTGPTEGSYAAQVQESLGKSTAPVTKRVKEYYAGAQPIMPPAWFAEYRDNKGAINHAVLVLPTTDRNEARKEFESRLPKSFRINTVDEYPGYTNFNLLAGSLKSQGWTFLNKEEAESIAEEFRSQRTRGKKKAKPTVREAVYHVGQTGKPPRPASMPTKASSRSTVSVGIGRWDSDQLTGEALYDKILAKIEKLGAHYDLEESDPDLDTNSTLPQEEFVNFDVHFDNPSKADHFRKWARKLGADGDVMVEHAIREGRKEEAEPADMFAVYRKNLGGSTIGEQDNMEDFVVYTCNCKDEAEKKAAALNASITADEKAFFETEYAVKQLKVAPADVPEGASKKVKEKKNLQESEVIAKLHKESGL